MHKAPRQSKKSHGMHCLHVQRCSWIFWVLKPVVLGCSELPPDSPRAKSQKSLTHFENNQSRTRREAKSANGHWSVDSSDQTQ